MGHDVLSPGRIKALWCWMAFQYLLLPQMVSFALGVFCSDALVNFVYHLLPSLFHSDVVIFHIGQLVLHGGKLVVVGGEQGFRP